MSNKAITVFFHKDLDGIVSYLVLCWLYNKKLDYVATTPANLSNDFQTWITSETHADRLYFLDLDVSKIGCMIDHPTTVILDHHKTNIYPFQHAITRIYNETSCAKIVYDTFFKNTERLLSNNKKTLIALADDWDSHVSSTPLSESLNIVYHSLTNKVESFIEDYYDGFIPFDKFKQNTIDLYKKHRSGHLKELKPFIGKVEFEGSSMLVGAVFCEKYIQECCDFLIKKYKVDVAIAVMVNQKRIAARRNPNNTSIDVSKFVQRIASGGGHEYAAGGNITDEFIEFTKMLNPIE